MLLPFLVIRLNLPSLIRNIRRVNVGSSAWGPLLVAGYLLSPILKEGRGYESLVLGKRPRVKDSDMNPKNSESSQQLQPEYDFSEATRGKHHDGYVQGTNITLLDSDVAEVFKDSAAVNEALRLLLRLAREQSNITRSA